MAENSLLALPAGINDSEIIFDGEVDGKPAILSTSIANHFNKNHRDLLRAIDSLMSILPESFNGRNFAPVAYYDNKGERRRAFLLTRDAFSLLAMGLTGKAAIIWKLRYIEAFNALERAALDNTQALAYEAGYKIGRDETLRQPALQAERKLGYLEGFKDGKRLAAKNDKLDVLIKIRSYVEKGLTYREIGKILGISKSAVGWRIAAAKKKGFWPLMPQAPVQGNLMEAGNGNS